MPDEKLTLQIPGVDVGSIARSLIAAELTKALVGAEAAITGIVAAALTEKVDSKGQRSTYPSNNTIPYAEWLARDLIQKATAEALAAKVEAMKPTIRAAIEANLKRQTKSIAASLTDHFASICTSGHWLKIDVTAKIDSSRD